MSFDLQRLYELLPVVDRLRDIDIASNTEGLLDNDEQKKLHELLTSTSPLSATDAARLVELQDKAQTGPLKALLSVVSEQVAVIEENLDQLYDDLFIETCAEWVVPYIADLVGVRGIVPLPGTSFTRRAEVANAIAGRRRKGTASMLEQLARDVTRWDAHVVEYFKVLATTQFMNHLRLFNHSFPNLRFDTLATINTPFDAVPHTVDVRNIASASGKYNIPNVGIWLWRIKSYPVTNAPAYKVDDYRWKFDVLGRDVQLYNRRDSDVSIDSFARPADLPAPITRALASRRPDTYDRRSFSFRLTVDGEDEEYVICDLRDYGGGWSHQRAASIPSVPSAKHAVDPELGRIALAYPAKEVFVTHHYGFSADIGGGEYTRPATADDSKTKVYNVPTHYTDIANALQTMGNEWKGGAAFDCGVVQLVKNSVYEEALSFDIPKGKNVVMRAAQMLRPVVVLSAPADIVGEKDSEFHLDGVLLAGNSLNVPRFSTTGADNLLDVVRIVHSTVLEPVTIDADEVSLTIERSIVGPLYITDDAKASITDTIVDANLPSSTKSIPAAADGQTREAYCGVSSGEAGAPLTIENATVIGTVHTRIMTLASNTIFAASSTTQPPVRAEQVQKGCVRFSFVPPGSRVPRRFRCQPQRAGVRPLFTSTRFGDAAYAQLARNCALEIRTGADDQSEMGAFHDLMQPQREANLRTRLDEFLRFGLEAGIFFAS